MMCTFNFVAISLAATLCMQADTVSGLVNIPPYTTYTDDTLLASLAIRDDLKPTKNQSAEFLKIYVAAIDLADKVAEKGENAYPEFYMETVKKAVKQVIDNPIDASNKLWNQLNNTKTALEKILSFVLYKQIVECDVPTSYECDWVVASGLKLDPVLDQSADLLIAGGKHAKNFQELSNGFKLVSENKNYDAEHFLVTGSDKMKPLVLAAAETQKVLQSLKL